jgi:hypothetical protein
MSVWDYIHSLQCLDFETFQGLITENCDVVYVFNGKMNSCIGREYVTFLKKEHFENTIKCDVQKLTIEKIKTPQNCPLDSIVYSIGDDTLCQRSGIGKGEHNPGIYELHSEGIITFLNGKIIRMFYAFIKSKRSICSENPQNPENPENPQNLENPENPQNPQNLENPENPQNPQNLENPENPQNPESNQLLGLGGANAVISSVNF